jgi:REP element-mobilizing transposase RayT
MTRKLGVQYPAAIYHVLSRGDRREDLFLDEVDRQDFLKTLTEACQKTDWQVHAYCPMENPKGAHTNLPKWLSSRAADNPKHPYS